MTQQQRQEQPANLEDVLDRLGEAADGEDGQVSLGVIVDAFGERTFAPLLLLPGLVTLAPLVGDIPGVPTLMAAVVLLTAGQMLLRRRSVWLPQALRNRSVSRGKVDKALGWLRRPARAVDRLLRPRLTFFTRGIGRSLIALTCVAIAAAMPPMEFVPFSANGAGLALTAFGLALIAHDGLLALLSFVVTAATIALVFFNLPW